MSADQPDAAILKLVGMAQSRQHAEVLVATSFPNLTPEEVKEAVDKAQDSRGASGDGDGPTTA